MITLQERVHGTLPPTDWRLNKLRKVLRVRKGMKNTGMQENNLLSLSYGRIIRKDIGSTEGLLPESFETYQIVEPGNIVMRLTDLQNDKRSLRQGLVKERGIITSAYDALEVDKDSDPRFWAYALLALDLAKYYYSLGGGVRQSVKFSDFPNEWLATPNSRTQKSIADFLDRETTRVDLLIEKKKRLVEATEYEFLSRTTWSVTNGLEANRKTRPSGYAWHPTLPSDWTVTRLKFLCKRIVDCLHETPEHDDDGEYPSIRTSDVQPGKLSLESAKRVSRTEYLNRVQRLEPEPGDVVYTREGERYGIAAVVPPGAKLCLGQRMMMFRANHLVTADFLMWSLNGAFAYNYLKQDTAGATSPHLNIFDIRNVPVFLPPKEEQERICSELAKDFNSKERLIALVERTVTSLREFRAALITAAVTGQIDVATWGKQGETDRRVENIEEALRA